MTIRTILLRHAACAVPLLLAAGARGQGFNVDVNMDTDPELGGGGPSSAFSAASPGQVGFWNGLSTGNFSPFPLRGLSGQPTDVVLTATGLGGGGAWRNEANTGDFALLMNDVEAVSTDLQYRLTGMRPGRYAVYTYACRPRPGSSGEAFVSIPGVAGGGSVRVAGMMPVNQFIEGVTHSVHQIDLTSSVLVMRIQGPWPISYVNGFQVSPVPEPAGALACLAGFGWMVRRRRRRS